MERQAGWIYIIVCLALVLILISLVGSIWAGFQGGDGLGEGISLENYREIMARDELPGVIGRTLLLGLGSVAVMLFFSIPISWLLARTDYRRKNLLYALLIANIAVPGFIVGMSYVFLFNPTAGIMNKLIGQFGLDPIFNVYSLSWMCFLQGVILVPVAVFMMVPALRNIDSTLEEACWMSGMSRTQAVRHVVFPLVAPALIAAALFFFIIAVEIFDIVGLIGLPGNIVVLSLLIYDELHPTFGLPHYGRAAVYGNILFVIAALAITLYMRLLRRAQSFQVVGGKPKMVQAQPLGRLHRIADFFVGLWVFFAFVIPVLTLLWTSLVPFLQPPSLRVLGQISLSGYVTALSYIGEPLKNTLLVMAITLGIAVTFSVAICWVVTRSGGRWSRWVDFIVFLSPAVPGMVAVVAFQYLALEIYQWLPLYGTIILMTLVMGSRMLAFCTRTINGAALQIHDELDEAAYTSGLTPLTTIRRIFIPLIAPAVLYSAFIVAVLSAKELTVPLMMNIGRKQVVSTFIFDLQANGAYEVSSAIGLYLIILLLTLVFIAGLFAKRLKVTIL